MTFHLSLFGTQSFAIGVIIPNECQKIFLNSAQTLSTAKASLKKRFHKLAGLET